MLMYCSYFTYGSTPLRHRKAFTEGMKAADIVGKISAAEKEGLVPKGTSGTLEEFFAADDGTQRAAFDEPSVSNS